MDTSAPPPLYSATAPPTENVESQPPQYTFPTSFKVGGVRTDGLLVSIPQIKGHLALLRAFGNLKSEVESCQNDILHMPLDKERRWAWFVGLSAERFDRWVRALNPTDAFRPIEETMPPLDVLMVWHSYMLNPRWYAEDGQRLPICAILHNIGKRFSDTLAQLPDLLSSPPSPARVQLFESRLLLPFDPLQSAPLLVAKFVPCPRCRSLIQVSFMTPAGTGYLQENFSAMCNKSGTCVGKPIKRDMLQARKLAENIARIGAAPDAFLPGTFFSNSQAADQRAGTEIKRRLHALFSSGKDTIPPSGINESICTQMLVEADYTMANMRGHLGRTRLLGRIMSAHLEPGMYSVELTGAVLRQGTFVGKMTDLGWTQPGYFDSPEDEVALQHAIARYHSFLDLMAATPGNFFVPTLDIDLAWHTHQICAVNYARDCQKYLGRFIDHDDKVDGFTLSNNFDLTCRAWKGRFGIDYTYCGCLLPGDTIGQRLSRFLSSKRDSKPVQLPTGALLVPESQLSVPSPDRADSLMATHASEHNAVHFVACNEAAAKDLVVRFNKHKEKKIKREEREAKKKAKDQKRKDDERELRHHDAAFLYPVPFMYAPMAGCAAYHPGVVAHGGACGNGNGQCGGGGCSGGGCGTGGCGGGCSGGSGGGGCGGGGGGCGGGGCGGGGS